MRSSTHVAAAALVATFAITGAAFAQPRPSNPPPSSPPPAVFDTEKPTSKSDAHRVVGRVLEIDQQGGVVKLDTEEGVVMAKPRPDLFRAARVGDMISVPRSENETPNASPATGPRTSPRAAPRK